MTSLPSQSDLTSARRRAIEAMASVHPRLARESNTTDLQRGYVYWQSARWLVERGLAYFPSGSTMLKFTPEGFALAREILGPALAKDGEA